MSENVRRVRCENKRCGNRYYASLLSDYPDNKCSECGEEMKDVKDFSWPTTPSTDEEKTVSITIPPSWDNGVMGTGRHECSTDCPRDHDAEWKDEEIMKKKF